MFNTLRKMLYNELNSLIKEADKEHRISSASRLLFGGIRDLVLRPGKMIRPILFLIGYMGYSKERSYPRKELVRAALSIELLHDFLLVHDDVIDRSPMRRGKPTLHRLFNSKLKMPATDPLGDGLAVVGGDIIYALAIEALLKANEDPRRKERALTELIRATIATGSGEFIDVVNAYSPLDKITLKDITNTYDLKTARYSFASPLAMGAILAGAPEKEVLKLRSVGMSLGRAFQVEDDLLDMFESSKATGKGAFSDLKESKRTLLVWKAYNSLSPGTKAELKRILDKKKKTRTDLTRFRDLVVLSGADRWCRAEVLRLVTSARGTASRLMMNDTGKKDLLSLVNTLFSRIP
ncbi:MAG: polyprenyl synthetase family protein [Candidatus Omnitrophica bacterium]|nr:polyprenyl synthetase family protein [Candidatus Omnitrophota bacterium]